MPEFATLLRNAWDERFGKDFKNDKRESKFLPFLTGDKSFSIFYSKKLEEWYLSEKGKKRYEQPGCFFCGGDELEVVLELEFNHLKFCYNPKFADKYHFIIFPQEHREFPNEKDIITLQEAALLTGLSIFGNLRNSGASYPQHIHYQSLDVIFPISNVTAEDIFCNDTVKVFRLNYPVAAFKLCTSGKKGLALIAHTVASISSPYNLLFYQNDLFIIPRTKSIPLNTGGFKFAAAEVCGCVFTRTKKMYESLNYSKIQAALRDVCFHYRSSEAKQFEGRLIKSLKKVLQ
jgi:hypothetical protein